MKKRYAKGTDTVDAKLTPREAVLNRNAAELLGRDAIKRLNAHGNMLAKRGVDLASLPSDPTPGPSTENMLGYQKGTEDVNYWNLLKQNDYVTASPMQQILAGTPRQVGGDVALPPQGLSPLQPLKDYSNSIMSVMWPGSGKGWERPTSKQFDQQLEQDKMARMQREAEFRRQYGLPGLGGIGYQMGTYDVGRDDRSDLLRDADSTFYGGGAPMPTPTPTSTPRMRYQYGTYDVQRRRNAASRIPYLDQSQARRAAAYRNAPQGQIIQGSGAGSGGYGYAPGTGSLPPEQNPAYQAALRNNPTPASRYAKQGPAEMVGTYRSDNGIRAAVSTGQNSFRTYDPQGGYIGRTGNAADFVNKQFGARPFQPSAVPTNPSINVNTPDVGQFEGAPGFPAGPIRKALPVNSTPTQSVATTPTSLTVNSTGFQPQGLEANPFAGAPIQLDIQPRRYSDLY